MEDLKIKEVQIQASKKKSYKEKIWLEKFCRNEEWDEKKKFKKSSMEKDIKQCMVVQGVNNRKLASYLIATLNIMNRTNKIISKLTKNNWNLQ